MYRHQTGTEKDGTADENEYLAALTSPGITWYQSYLLSFRFFKLNYENWLSL